MKLYIPKILFPAMGLPLDCVVSIEVENQLGLHLIKEGWIEKDD